MTRITSILKLVIPILVAFHVGLQFNLLFFRSGSGGSGGGHYRIVTDDCIDCLDLPQRDTYAYTASNSHSNVDDIKIKQPSYLKWSTKKPRIPHNWTYATPRALHPDLDDPKRGNLSPSMFVNPATKVFPPDPNKTIIVHYHMQHNAGTSFYQIARQFTVATRACWQTSKHCSVSYNEEVEADNIRDNYKRHGLQYISYEYMLPPRFPLPFVSESAREGLFFTTIMRNPMNRLITWARSKRNTPHQRGAPPENFWKDVNGKSGIYERENLNVRWLSGALETITEDHVNIAKCRLQLFDLVIVDTTYDAAVNDVVCPLNNWRGSKFCNSTQARGEHKSKKINPFNETDSHFVGAWIERLRPSFELYDYARILSYLQLKNRGVKDIPELYEVPSYIATLERYTDLKLNTPKESLVNLKNIGRFHPPKEFCNSLKKVWGSNADEVPYINGIGGLDPQ